MKAQQPTKTNIWYCTCHLITERKGMRHKEIFRLGRFEDRVKLAKLLLDRAVDFTTEKIVLEFVD
jgi:hypothetical protein